MGGMKTLLLLCLLATPPAHGAGKGRCVCTCVVKNEDSSYTTKSGSGPDRETAGEDLKKKLGVSANAKKTCELSPDCKGAACSAD